MLNLLITGSNSFLGKRLIQKINKNKYDVYGIDINSSKVKQRNHKFKRINLNNKNIKIFHGNFDIIIHLAAISNETKCKFNVSNCYNTNINGTINLLENTNLKRLKKFIFASSEWIYPASNKITNSNSRVDINKFVSHYASTKYLNEKLLNIYSNKHDFININLRFGILYGERLNNLSAFESLIIQTFKIKVNGKIKVGSFKTGRSYLYVNDAVEAILKSLITRKSLNYDIQGPEFITLRKILQITSKLMNKKINIKEINNKNKNIKKIDSEISKKNLNWHPKITPENGILRILDYFKKELKNEI